MFFSQTAPQDDEYHEDYVAEHDPSGEDGSFARRIGIAMEGSEYDGRPHRPNKPSIWRRKLPRIARFSFVVLIGVGMTLAWQSYHEEAKDKVRTWVPALAWLLPPQTKAGTSSEFGQQLKPIALNFALVRRGVEQLVADQKQIVTKQEEIAHDVAALQAVERDLRQNISSVPPPGTIQIQRHKPAQAPVQSLAVQ